MRRKIAAPVLATAMALAGLLLAPVSASAQQQPAGPGGLTLTSRVPASGSFNLHNVGAPGKCIGIDASNNAGDWNCTSNADQLWHWGPLNSSGFGQLINGTGKCLGVAGGGDAQGSRIVAFACLGTGHPDQYWAPSRSTTGSANLLNYQAWFDPNTPAQLVGVQGGSTANGAPLVLWAGDRSANQLWF